MEIKRVFLLIISCLFLGGCAGTDRGSNYAVGYIYTYTKEPYTTDLHKTPTGDHSVSSKIIKIEEPFTGYGIYAKLKSNAIADIARKHGMKKVYYADLETMSILGIWEHKKLYIHGE
jgi:hypothetical protein